jgi:ribose transport system substrate-binding protein
MKGRTLLLLITGACLVGIALTVGYRWDSILGTSDKAKPKVIVVFKMIDFSNAFWRNVRDGVESAGKDFGLDVSIRGPLSETSVEEQKAIVGKAIEEKPSAIVLAAADYELLVPVAREIKAKRIPLVCVDSFINSDDDDVRVGTNNIEAGRKCGEALLRLVPEGSTVAVMSYIKGSSTAIDREEGVRAYLSSKTILLETLYSNASSETAYLQAKRLIADTTELRGIVALNEPTAVGAARALAESGKSGSIALVAFDNSFEEIKFVEKGIIRDTIIQKPFNMGYLSVKSAGELIDGIRPPRSIDTGSLDINRENMFNPENQKLIFPVAGGP